MNRLLCCVLSVVIVGVLAACTSAPLQTSPPSLPASPAVSPAGVPILEDGAAVLPPVMVQGKSRWTPVRWSDLPGFSEDSLHEAWNAWIKSCERPGQVFVALCPDVRRLSIGSDQQQRAWMMSRLQPFRVESLQGDAEGLLTSYFEPVIDASRTPTVQFTVPLYQLPSTLGQRKPWYTRQEMDTQAAVQAQLQGRELAYLADPIDALILQIQGSGRVRMMQADGSVRMVRLAYAGSNDQPYKSVGRWLLDQGAIQDASWPGIKAWARQNPDKVQEMLWSNPRMIFFREEPLSDLDASFGPKGAQGVPLTPGRSIAVDPASVPYGTPVWLASGGPQVTLQRLVLAQDTGSAIVGAVRADYFAGWGAEAGELAGRLKQPLRMWVLWPR